MGTGQRRGRVEPGRRAAQGHLEARRHPAPRRLGALRRARHPDRGSAAGRHRGAAAGALTSLYALFAITREVLRRHGPQVAMPTRDSEYSLGQIAVAVLNDELRPLLARWHPALGEWEARRPPDSSRVAHEDAWEHARALRAELAGTRRRLADYAALLATACGVPDLTTRR